MPSNTSRNGTRPRLVGSHSDSSGVSSTGRARATTPWAASVRASESMRRRRDVVDLAPGGWRPASSISSRMAAASMPSAMNTDRTGRRLARAAPAPPAAPRPDRRRAPEGRSPGAPALPGRSGSADRPDPRTDPAGPVPPLTPAGLRAEAPVPRPVPPRPPEPPRPPVPPLPALPRPPAPLRPPLRRSRAHRAELVSRCPRSEAIRTTAVQAIPSARPRAPSPSARVAFTLTGAPSTDGQPFGHLVDEGGQTGAAPPPPCSRH